MWAVLAVVIIADVMDLLDATITNTAIHGVAFTLLILKKRPMRRSGS